MKKRKHYYYNLVLKKIKKGKTSGSRVSFINIKNNITIEMHKPHPRNVLKEYQIKNLIQKLEKWSDLE